jgi:pimeloyl-ACP methyl ester carboxylesterase
VAVGPPVLLVHGFQEHAHTWDLLAPLLAAAGHRVAALDWRGHGDSEWLGRGGYYHFADYVADLAGVVRALGGRVLLVGHSMGGNAALLYAGTEPERVAGLVSIEGTGPPDATPDVAPARFAAWVEDLERASGGGREPLALEDAARRLQRFFPLPDPIARHLALNGTREAADGLRTWKFDPLHSTRSPQPFYEAQARAFWARIACPVLYVEGARTFLSASESQIAERLRALRADRVTIEHAAHHPHLEQPADTAQALLAHFDRCR